MALPIVDQWHLTGPGATHVSHANGSWDFRYRLRRAGFHKVTWSVTSNPVSESGNYTFNWDYSGFHGWYDVTAFLTSSDGNRLVDASSLRCCSTPSAGFHYNGSFTFAGVNTGDKIGFTMGGSNFDRYNVLRGKLHLTQAVPGPASILLLACGLGFIGLMRRCRTV